MRGVAARVTGSRPARPARPPEGAPRLEIDPGASLPAWIVWGAALVAGTLAVLMCWWAGAPGFVLSVTAILLVAMLALPRTWVPVLWFAVVGQVLVTTEGVLGPARPLWVVTTIASVHAAVAATSLVENLLPDARIGVGALRLRLHTLWRPQLVAQVIGVLAWWPLRTQQPWLAVAALVGVTALTWLLLRPRPRRP